MIDILIFSFVFIQLESTQYQADLQLFTFNGISTVF